MEGGWWREVVGGCSEGGGGGRLVEGVLDLEVVAERLWGPAGGK